MLYTIVAKGSISRLWLLSTSPGLYWYVIAGHFDLVCPLSGPVFEFV